MCPASTPAESSTGGSHGHEEPKGSHHHGDNWGGKPWAAQAFEADPSATQRCPARSEPLALPVAPVWAGQASLLTQSCSGQL